MTTNLNREPVGTTRKELAEMDRELAEFRRSEQWLAANRPQLLEKYENLWVAVYHEGLTCAAADYDELLTQIDKKGVPRGWVVTQFLVRHEPTLVF
jgi:hypothetical protein